MPEQKTNGKHSSSALHSFNVKTQDAQARLWQCFVAFVKTPGAVLVELSGEETPLSGYIIMASYVNESLLSAQNFTAFYVGAPTAQVQEAVELVNEVCANIENVYSEEDVHSTMIVDTLSKYYRFLLDLKDEPRAVAVEFLFVDYMNNAQWVRFDGSSGDIDLESRKKSITIVGCYDHALERELRKYLRATFHAKGRKKLSLTQKEMKLIERDIKKMTKLRYAYVVPSRLNQLS